MIRLFKKILDKVITIDEDTTLINNNTQEIKDYIEKVKKTNDAPETDGIFTNGYSYHESNNKYATEKIEQTNFQYYNITDTSEKDINSTYHNNKTAGVNYINVRIIPNGVEGDLHIFLYNVYYNGYNRVFTTGIGRSSREPVNQTISIDIPIIANYNTTDNRFGYIVATANHMDIKVTIAYYTKP
jgi:hypothetical protein